MRDIFSKLKDCKYNKLLICLLQLLMLVAIAILLTNESTSNQVKSVIDAFNLRNIDRKLSNSIYLVNAIINVVSFIIVIVTLMPICIVMCYMIVLFISLCMAKFSVSVKREENETNYVNIQDNTKIVPNYITQARLLC